MDKINYDKTKFLKLHDEIKIFLKKIKVTIYDSVPISAKFGDNITEISKNMEWYDGETFCNLLDNFKVEVNLSNMPLRLPVQDIYKINDKRIIVGRVESGKINIKDKLLFLPSNQTAKIKSFESWKNDNDDYSAGENVAITLDEQLFVDKGNLISHTSNTPKIMNTFEASIFWLSSKNLDLAKNYQLKINTGEYDVKIKNISKVVDTDDLSEKNLNFLRKMMLVKF